MGRENTSITKRVLVADREAQICRMIGVLLECSLGVDAIEVGEADQALVALRDQDISLAVLDAGTLGRNGLVAVQRIAKERPKLGVVICFSGVFSESEPAMQKAVADWGGVSLSKPFRVAELLEAAREIQHKWSASPNSSVDGEEARADVGTGNPSGNEKGI